MEEIEKDATVGQGCESIRSKKLFHFDTDVVATRSTVRVVQVVAWRGARSMGQSGVREYLVQCFWLRACLRRSGFSLF